MWYNTRMIFRLFLTITFLSFFVSFSVFSREKSEGFVVIYDKRVKVLSPMKYHKKLSILIENKMLGKLLVKIVRENGDLIDIISVVPNNPKSVEFEMKRKEKILFIPLSPPAQTIELTIGRKSYEIPPKR